LFGINEKYLVRELIDNSFIVIAPLQQFVHGQTYSQIRNNVSKGKQIIILKLGDMENTYHVSQMSIPIELCYENDLLFGCSF